jgi:hypothetical protein
VRRADLSEQRNENRWLASLLGQLTNLREIRDARFVASVALGLDRSKRGTLVDRDRVERMGLLAGASEAQPQLFRTAVLDCGIPCLVDLAVEKQNLDQDLRDTGSVFGAPSTRAPRRLIASACLMLRCPSWSASSSSRR